MERKSLCVSEATKNYWMIVFCPTLQEVMRNMRFSCSFRSEKTSITGSKNGKIETEAKFILKGCERRTIFLFVFRPQIVHGWKTVENRSVFKTRVCACRIAANCCPSFASSLRKSPTFGYVCRSRGYTQRVYASRALPGSSIKGRSLVRRKKQKQRTKLRIPNSFASMRLAHIHFRIDMSHSPR